MQIRCNFRAILVRFYCCLSFPRSVFSLALIFIFFAFKFTYTLQDPHNYDFLSDIFDLLLSFFLVVRSKVIAGLPMTKMPLYVCVNAYYFPRPCSSHRAISSCRDRLSLTRMSRDLTLNYYTAYSSLIVDLMTIRWSLVTTIMGRSIHYRLIYKYGSEHILIYWYILTDERMYM